MTATRPLAGTGINVTPIGFGAGPLGGFYGAVDAQTGAAAARRAYELGVRYFDVAPSVWPWPRRARAGPRAARLAARRFHRIDESRALPRAGRRDGCAAAHARGGRAVQSGARLLARGHAARARAVDAAPRRGTHRPRLYPRRRCAFSGQRSGGGSGVSFGHGRGTPGAGRVEARRRDPRDRHRPQPATLGVALGARGRSRRRDDRRAPDATQPRGRSRPHRRMPRARHRGRRRGSVQWRLLARGADGGARFNYRPASEAVLQSYARMAAYCRAWAST